MWGCLINLNIRSLIDFHNDPIKAEEYGSDHEDWLEQTLELNAILNNLAIPMVWGPHPIVYIMVCGLSRPIKQGGTDFSQSQLTTGFSKRRKFDIRFKTWAYLASLWEWIKKKLIGGHFIREK